MFGKRLIWITLAIPLMAFSCSEAISVFTRFASIDSDEPHLKLYFEFKRMNSHELMLVDGIEIFRNDTLVCRMRSKTGSGISVWHFPSVPDEFTLDTLVCGNTIPEFYKNQNLRFVFRSRDKKPGYGSWYYSAAYSDQRHRWMFDEKGNQSVRLNFYYEPWIGKDIVKIESSEFFQVNGSLFEISSLKGDLIDFEVKYKRNPTNRVALVLDKSVKSGEMLDIRFMIDSTKSFRQVIVVPDKSNIGIAGKFRDL